MNGDDQRPPLRVWLFVPGDDEHKVRKTPVCAADAIVLDLEDAVDPARKQYARERIPGFLDDLARSTGAALLVRINSLETGLAFRDLDAVTTSRLWGVVVPKVENVGDLQCLDRYLRALEKERELPPDAVRLIPAIETARGVSRAFELTAAASDRVFTFAFGPGDLSADLGLQFSSAGADLTYPRSVLPIACRAARLHAPIDGPCIDLEDSEELHDDTVRSARLGYKSRFAIHPRQVPIIRRALVPAAEDLAFARAATQAFEAAATDQRAAIQVRGRLVDRPVYEAAKSALAGASAMTITPAHTTIEGSNG